MNADTYFITSAKAKGYTDDQIKQFLAQEEQSRQDSAPTQTTTEAKPKSNFIVENLPTIGSVALGTPGLIYGGIAGATAAGAAGAAGGEYLKQKIKGEKTSGKKIASEAIQSAAIDLATAGAGKFLKLGGKAAVKGATKVAEGAANVGKTAFKAGLNTAKNATKTIGKEGLEDIGYKAADLMSGVEPGTMRYAKENAEGVSKAVSGDKAIYNLVEPARQATKKILDTAQSNYAKNIEPINRLLIPGLEEAPKNVLGKVNSILNRYSGLGQESSVFTPAVLNSLDDLATMSPARRLALAPQLSGARSAEDLLQPTFDFSQGAFVNRVEQNNIKEIVKSLSSNKSNKVQDLLALRRRLQQYSLGDFSKPYHAALGEITGELDNEIMSRLPKAAAKKFKQANLEYESKRVLHDVLARTLDSSNAEGFLANIMGKNKTEKQAFLKELANYSDKNFIKDIQDVLVAKELGRDFAKTGSRSQDIVRGLLFSSVGGLSSGPLGALVGLMTSYGVAPRQLGDVFISLGKGETPQIARYAQAATGVGKDLLEVGKGAVKNVGEQAQKTVSDFLQKPATIATGRAITQGTGELLTGGGQSGYSEPSDLGDETGGLTVEQLLNPSTAQAAGSRATSDSSIGQQQLKQLAEYDFMKTGGKNLDKIIAYGKIAYPETKQTKKSDAQIKSEATVKRGISSVNKAQELLTKDPTLPYKNRIKGQIFSRDYNTAIFSTIEALLRLNSGAAAPEPEYRRYLESLIPKPLESTAVSQRKLAALKEALNYYKEGYENNESGFDLGAIQ